VTGICAKTMIYLRSKVSSFFLLLDILVIAVPFSVSRYSLSYITKKNVIEPKISTPIAQTPLELESGILRYTCSRF
jgi:hypothetical protein